MNKKYLLTDRNLFYIELNSRLLRINDNFEISETKCYNMLTYYINNYNRYCFENKYKIYKVLDKIKFSDLYSYIYLNFSDLKFKVDHIFLDCTKGLTYKYICSKRNKYFSYIKRETYEIIFIRNKYRYN